MRIIDIQIIAREKGLRPGKRNKTELIRAIQLHEKNIPCFETSLSSRCDRIDCLWRQDCL